MIKVYPSRFFAFFLFHTKGIFLLAVFLFMRTGINAQHASVNITTYIKNSASFESNGGEEEYGRNEWSSKLTFQLETESSTHGGGCREANVDNQNGNYGCAVFNDDAYSYDESGTTPCSTTQFNQCDLSRAHLLSLNNLQDPAFSDYANTSAQNIIETMDAWEDDNWGSECSISDIGSYVWNALTNAIGVNNDPCGFDKSAVCQDVCCYSLEGASNSCADFYSNRCMYNGTDNVSGGSNFLGIDWVEVCQFRLFSINPPGGPQLDFFAFDDARFLKTDSFKFRQYAPPGYAVDNVMGNSVHMGTFHSEWNYSGSGSPLPYTIYCASSTPPVTYPVSGSSVPDIFSWTVPLEAGRKYQFSTNNGSTLEDTYLRLYGSDGVTIVAESDFDTSVVPPSIYAAIFYTPTQTGNYYLEVSKSSNITLYPTVQTINGVTSTIYARVQNGCHDETIGGLVVPTNSVSLPRDLLTSSGSITTTDMSPAPTAVFTAPVPDNTGVVNACLANSLQFIVTPNALTTYFGKFQYQWGGTGGAWSNGLPDGTSASNPNMRTGADTAYWGVDTLIGNTTKEVYIRAIVTGGNCADTIGPLHIHIGKPATAGVLVDSLGVNDACVGDSIIYVSNGGSGTYQWLEYEWTYPSGAPAWDTLFSPITSGTRNKWIASRATYASGGSNPDIFYVRAAYSNGSGCGAVYSNVVHNKVTGDSVRLSLASSPSTACEGSTVTITATPGWKNGSTWTTFPVNWSVLYSWYRNDTLITAANNSTYNYTVKAHPAGDPYSDSIKCRLQVLSQGLCISPLDQKSLINIPIVGAYTAPTALTRSNQCPASGTVCAPGTVINTGTNLGMLVAPGGSSPATGCQLQYSYSTDATDTTLAGTINATWSTPSTPPSTDFNNFFIPGANTHAGYYAVIKARWTNCTGGTCPNSDWAIVAKWKVVAAPTISAGNSTFSPAVSTVCAAGNSYPGATLSELTPADSAGGYSTCHITYEYKNSSSWTTWNGTANLPSFIAGIGPNGSDSIRASYGGCTPASANGGACFIGCNASPALLLHTWTVVSQPSTITITRRPDFDTVCTDAFLTLNAVTLGANAGTGCPIEYAYNNYGDAGDPNSSHWVTSGSPPSFAAGNFGSYNGSIKNGIRVRRNCGGTPNTTTGCGNTAWTYVYWVISDTATAIRNIGTQNPASSPVCPNVVLQNTVTDPNNSCSIEYSYSIDNGVTLTNLGSVNSFNAVEGDVNSLWARRVNCNLTNCPASSWQNVGTWTVTPAPAGATANNPIPLGTIGCTPMSSPNTQANTATSNSCYGDDNSYVGDDVYYKFAMTYPGTVAISTCGSTFDTHLYLLDGLGNKLYESSEATSNGVLATAQCSPSNRAFIYYTISQQDLINGGNVFYAVVEGQSYTDVGNISLSVKLVKPNDATYESSVQTLSTALSSPSTICPTTATTFSVGGTNYYRSGYQWSFDISGPTFTDPITTSYTGVTNGTTYAASVTSITLASAPSITPITGTMVNGTGLASSTIVTGYNAGTLTLTLGTATIATVLPGTSLTFAATDSSSISVLWNAYTAGKVTVTPTTYGGTCAGTALAQSATITPSVLQVTTALVGTPCVGDAVTLTATTSPTTTNTYWQGVDNGGTSSSTSPQGTSQSVNPVLSGTHKYYVRQWDGASCWGPLDSISVTGSQPSPPTISITSGTSEVISPYTCISGTVTVRATSTDGSPAIWWQSTYAGQQTTISGTASGGTWDRSVSTAGKSYIKARGANGCWGLPDSINIAVMPASPTNPVSGTSPACGSITLTTSAVAGGTNIYWQTSSSGTDQTIASGSAATFSPVGTATYLTNTYYARAKNTSVDGCWSVPPGSGKTIFVGKTPSAPSLATYNWGTTVTGTKGGNYADSYDVTVSSVTSSVNVTVNPAMSAAPAIGTYVTLKSCTVCTGSIPANTMVTTPTPSTTAFSLTSGAVAQVGDVLTLTYREFCGPVTITVNGASPSDILYWQGGTQAAGTGAAYTTNFPVGTGSATFTLNQITGSAYNTVSGATSIQFYAMSGGTPTVGMWVSGTGIPANSYYVYGWNSSSKSITLASSSLTNASVTATIPVGTIITMGKQDWGNTTTTGNANYGYYFKAINDYSGAPYNQTGFGCASAGNSLYTPPQLRTQIVPPAPTLSITSGNACNPSNANLFVSNGLGFGANANTRFWEQDNATGTSIITVSAKNTGLTPTSNSTTVNMSGDPSPLPTVGSYVTGAGIPANTTVVSYPGGSPYTLTLSNASTIQASTPLLFGNSFVSNGTGVGTFNAVSDNTAIISAGVSTFKLFSTASTPTYGMAIAGPGIPMGTYVTGYVSPNLSISANTIGSGIPIGSTLVISNSSALSTRLVTSTSNNYVRSRTTNVAPTSTSTTPSGGCWSSAGSLPVVVGNTPSVPVAIPSFCTVTNGSIDSVYLILSNDPNSTPSAPPLQFSATTQLGVNTSSIYSISSTSQLFLLPAVTGTNTYSDLKVVDNFGCPNSSPGYSYYTPYHPTDLLQTTTPVSQYTKSADCYLLGRRSWVTFRDTTAGNRDKAILSIRDNGNNMGKVTVTLYKEAAEPSIPLNGCTGDSMKALKRHYLIKPTTQPTSSVDVRLYFTVEELDSLSTASRQKTGTNCSNADDVPASNGINYLYVTKYHDPNTNSPTEDGNYLNNLTSTGYYKVYGDPAPNAIHLPDGSLTKSAGGFSSIFSGGTAHNYVELSVSELSEFWIHGSAQNGALPVTMIYLEANPINNIYIQVRWATATEINNDGFKVERSVDGQTWTQIGWVEGHDNSTVRNDYSYDDRDVTPGVRYYYRLKQMDNDGQFEYTDVVSAIITGKITFEVKDFVPNPAANTTTLKITAVLEQKITVDFYDVLGRKVLSGDHTLVKGDNKIEFDISRFASGTYTAVVTSNNEVYAKKLVVTP
jgi:hypothetical protein